MSDLPGRVEIVEEGPREGMQSEPPGIPTADKVALVEALAAAGLARIACCSFVDPGRLPQMADAEAIAAGLRRRPGVFYGGLWLNEKGFRRAQATSLDLEGVTVTSASETFLQRNNNRTRARSLDDQRHMLGLYAGAAVPPGPAYVFTAFGCNDEGDVPLATVVDAAGRLLAVNAEAGSAPTCLYLCDTIGAANPRLVQRVVGAVRERWPELPVGLHLHDTRGLGLANVAAALALGVARFDASCGGLGGCPFAGNRSAAGNVCTEDLAFLCAEMGIETGLDLDALIEAARLAERIVGHPLPGRLMKAGTLARFRRGGTADAGRGA